MDELRADNTRMHRRYCNTPSTFPSALLWKHLAWRTSRKTYSAADRGLSDLRTIGLPTPRPENSRRPARGPPRRPPRFLGTGIATTWERARKAGWALSQSRLLFVFFRGLVLAPAGLDCLLRPGCSFLLAERTPPSLGYFATCLAEAFS